MSALLPCPSCTRHVRQTEAGCPFCGVALALADVPPRPMPTQRLGRAAMLAFGAAIATSAVGCGTAQPADDAAVNRADTGGAASDAGADGGPIAAYGGPMFDAGDDAAAAIDAGPAVDADQADAWGAALYGAPPPPPTPDPQR